MLGLAAVLLAAALPAPASASVPSPSYAETRVRGFELQHPASVGAERALSPTRTGAYAARYDELAVGYPLVPRGTPRLLGPGTTYGAKIEGQLAKRGWTKRLVQSSIDDPVRTVTTRDTRYLPGGGRLADPATAYYNRRGGYVVRNDGTGDIVQVSDRTDSAWRAPWD